MSKRQADDRRTNQTNERSTLLEKGGHYQSRWDNIISGTEAKKKEKEKEENKWKRNILSDDSVHNSDGLHKNVK